MPKKCRIYECDKYAKWTIQDFYPIMHVCENHKSIYSQYMRLLRTVSLTYCTVQVKKLLCELLWLWT